MRSSSNSANLPGVLRGGSFRRELVADVFYGSTRLLADVPLEDWTLTGDADAEIKTAATATVVYSGDFAESVTPRDLTDALSPFGQEMYVYMLISAGGFEDRIPMGVYRIDDVPSASDAQIRFRERVITVGSRVQLTLLDRFVGVKRALFRSLEQPPSLTSAWAEFARITKLQVTRNVSDVAIPNTVTYSRSRISAAQQIAGVLGGRAFMLADGTAGIIPDVPGAAVAELQIGEEGVVMDVDYSLHSEGVYNVVVLDFEDENGNPLHSEAPIGDGPLSVNGPYGEYVTEYPSDQREFITTQEQGDAAVLAHLQKVSVTDSYELPVQCIIDPRLELGDVVTVQRMDRTITGRVKKYTMGRTGPMSLTLQVLDDVPV